MGPGDHAKLVCWQGALSTDSIKYLTDDATSTVFHHFAPCPILWWPRTSLHNLDLCLSSEGSTCFSQMLFKSDDSSIAPKWTCPFFHIQRVHNHPTKQGPRWHPLFLLVRWVLLFHLCIRVPNHFFFRSQASSSRLTQLALPSCSRLSWKHVSLHSSIDFHQSCRGQLRNNVQMLIDVNCI